MSAPKKLVEVSDSARPGFWASPWPCAILATAAGLFLISTIFGAGLQHWAYDTLFLARNARAPNEAVIVYMDERSFKELAQPLNAPWSRALHGQFLRRMKEAGAKAVVFDIVFSDAGDPAEDKEFSAGIQQHGMVFAGADLMETRDAFGRNMSTTVKPTKEFQQAGLRWGHVLLAIDPDYAVRRQLPPERESISLAATAARALGATLPPDQTESPVWMNYYGPAGTIPGISYFQAMLDSTIQSGLFKGKVVFVGQKLHTDLQGKLKDEFATPFTWSSREFAPGVEVQATAFLNLVRGDYLRRLPLPLELGIILAVGIGLGWLLPRLSTPRGFICAAGAVAVLAGAAAASFNWGRWWWAWTIPVVQIGVAWTYALASQAWRNYREKQRLEDSLALHLSPSRVRQLMHDPELLRPGGHEAEITVLFSDIAGFSTLAETMMARDIFDLLNQYYECALQSVFNEDGMVVSLIGDAIVAAWNAPDAQPDHQVRACRAAVDLQHRLLEFDRGHHRRPMHTRVGVHTGTAIVGNLGSRSRFQFTAIGETVNLASRLEGLNKYLGTSVLASRQAQTHVEGILTSRYLGDFVLKGFARAVEVYELLGGRELEEPTRAWRESFAAALRDYQRGNLASARAKFQQTIALRRQAKSARVDEPLEDDGPSTFYLAEIERIESQAAPSEDNGVVRLMDK